MEIGLEWFRESFEVNYTIGFGIPIEFPSQRKKLLKSVLKQENAKIVMFKMDTLTFLYL